MWNILASAALAQDAPPGLDVVPVDQWVKLLTGADLQVMMGIGVVAFVLYRIQKIPDWVAFLVPMVLGGLYGLTLALEQRYAFGSHVLKGFLVNGAGATLTGYGVHKVLSLWMGDGRDTRILPPK